VDALNKILNAAVELFRQYGFKTITMDDIARRAGISKKTLYQQFANKNEVVSEAVLWYSGKMYDMCMELTAGAENAIEAMVRIMSLIDDSYCQINPMALLELQRYYPEGYDVFRNNLLKKDVEAVRSNIIQGMEEGLYREEIDADIMARFHIESALMILQPNLMVSDRNSLQRVNQLISEHFLYGIMTARGEKLYRKYKEKYTKQVSKI